MRDALYTAWCEDRRSARPRPLTDWLQAYGDYADELLDWISQEPVSLAAEAAPVDHVAEKRTQYLGRKTLADFLSTHPAPVASLLKTARQQGMDVEALAAHLNLSEPMVYKLERRLLRVGSIPGILLKNLAETLQLGVQQIRDYLAQSPQLAPGAMYRAESAPRASRQDFADAVAADYELSDDQKAYWQAEIEGRGKRGEGRE